MKIIFITSTLADTVIEPLFDAQEQSYSLRLTNFIG
jgi:hypothetical protein